MDYSLLLVVEKVPYHADISIKSSDNVSINNHEDIYIFENDE